jgi:hypothetical protein
MEERTATKTHRSEHEQRLFEVTIEIAQRLTTIFLRDENGRRPV